MENGGHATLLTATYPTTAYARTAQLVKLLFFSGFGIRDKIIIKPRD